MPDWRTRPNEIAAVSREDDAFDVKVPLYDGTKLQGHLRFVMTQDRKLTIFWEQEPDVEGLTSFRAWSREV